MLEAEIIGNLGGQAEIREGEYIKFRVAHTAKTLREGTTIERTQWVTIFCKPERAKIVPYLTTGTKIFVRGALSSRVYVDNAGVTQAGLTIHASFIELCGSRPQPQPTPTNTNNDPF